MTDDVRDGWHSPEDRKLMVRAVARMSDDCEAPELTPECPFYEVTTAGDPVCAEQCQDLIARYPGDLLSTKVVGLGVGLVATRRRPRRGPAANEMAYDAGQIRLEDGDRELHEWRFGSLLTLARERAFAPSGEHQNSDISTDALLSELDRRGIHSGVVLPLGLAKDKYNAVAVAMVLMDSGESHARVAANLTARGDEWRHVLTAFGGLDSGGERASINARGRQAILGWLYTCDATLLLSDAVPSAADLEAGLLVDADEQLVLDARWMIERFTYTYPAQWSSASRAREWRFIRAHRPGCCPPGLMRQRVIDPIALANALADEHCTREEEQPEESRSWTPNHFKSVAVRRLTEGRPEAAAEAFRVLSELLPSDADVANDLGFCLLPSAPKEAIGYLRSSLELGPMTPTLTRLNLALAFHLSGLNDEALTIALGALAEGSAGRDPFYYVWHIRDGSLDFAPTDDLLMYGEELISHMAECEGACILENLPL